MSCCGGKRQALSLNLRSANGASSRTAERGGVPTTTGAHLRYSGEGPLVVVGPVTGARYEFGWSGAILVVDSRDARALAGVPTLAREG